MSGSKLSDRLIAAADCVAAAKIFVGSPQNYTVVDCGCDHAYLAIHLVNHGIASRCIASDVRTGPLAAAKEHIEEAGLSESIETVLSDGVKSVNLEEADCLCILGMGGRLMTDILEAGGERVSRLNTLVLSPQSEPELVRACVFDMGLHIEGERCVFEDGKYYVIMLVQEGKENEPYNPHELRFGRAAVKIDVINEINRLETLLKRDISVREKLEGLPGESAREKLAPILAEIKELELSLAEIKKYECNIPDDKEYELTEADIEALELLPAKRKALKHNNNSGD
ncbi:MAG: SAM-dependent methyltransferase [Lachnospiraceae bacterium]|nr:SAM-dependent methyltransferase [Lachnospiraceae bacterium]